MPAIIPAPGLGRIERPLVPLWTRGRGWPGDGRAHRRRDWPDNDLVTHDAGQEQRTDPGGLVWQADLAGETCDLSGHFWATLRSGHDHERTMWSWMIIG
jgi:hypothetical protein